MGKNRGISNVYSREFGAGSQKLYEQQTCRDTACYVPHEIADLVQLKAATKMD